MKRLNLKVNLMATL